MRTPKEEIEKLNRKIFKCKKCKEVRFCTSGYGNPKSQLLLVGQSLHSYNPETNPQIPFVGPVKHMDSGVLLYDILNRSGYSFDNPKFFITNIVHGHPPKNRASLRVEIDNCRPFLEEELRIVNPKTVVTIGNDAREWFELPMIPSGKLVYVYSKKYNGKLIMFIIVKHPSYINRLNNPKIRKQYIKEFKEVIT